MTEYVEAFDQVFSVKGYEQLACILTDAYAQAAKGKGAERHANDKPFHEEPMQLIAQRRGIGFILGQADKKSEEAQGMLDRGDIKAFEREILGAIVYLAGSVIFARHQVADVRADEPLIKAQTVIAHHPTWPDDKDFRWMAQDADGEWYAFETKPGKVGNQWDTGGSCRRLGTTSVIGDWRDTLIERGADE